jgi:hypothetical protein
MPLLTTGAVVSMTAGSSSSGVRGAELPSKRARLWSFLLVSPSMHVVLIFNVCRSCFPCVLTSGFKELGALMTGVIPCWPGLSVGDQW